MRRFVLVGAAVLSLSACASPLDDAYAVMAREERKMAKLDRGRIVKAICKDPERASSRSVERDTGKRVRAEVVRKVAEACPRSAQ